MLLSWMSLPGEFDLYDLAVVLFLGDLARSLDRLPHLITEYSQTASTWYTARGMVVLWAITSVSRRS